MKTLKTASAYLVVGVCAYEFAWSLPISMFGSLGLTGLILIMFTALERSDA